MVPRTVKVLLVLFLCALSGLAGGRAEKSILGSPLLPVPPSPTMVPLRDALSQIGLHVQANYVVFGIELEVDKDGEPKVFLAVEENEKLQDALKRTFQQIPAYSFQVVGGHLVNVYPVGAKENPRDPLNLRVSRFDVTNVPPGNILSHPQDYIPELEGFFPGEKERRSSFGRGLGDTGPGVTLHLQNVTVRQILNSISRATEEFPASYSPYGWVCQFRPDRSSPVGGVLSCAVQLSAPSGWKGLP